MTGVQTCALPIWQWFTNGPQDVMELDGGDRVRLVPWVPTVVKKVDLEAKRVEVEWQADW